MTQPNTAGNNRHTDYGQGTDNDDAPVGRVLSRREVLALLGLSGAAALATACQPMSAGQPPAPQATAVGDAAAAGAAAAGAAAAGAAAAGAANTVAGPACVARPEMMEGPYFVDLRLNRSDIRRDANTGAIKEGAPLLLTFRVSQIGADACTPLAGALVDVWHCDAQGTYSGVTDRSFNTTGENWLRGYQVTDSGGTATFTTIYPGWYPGRTVHIHFKVRTDPEAAQSHEFTSQLFFEDMLTDQVLAQEPYNVTGPRTRNTDDRIFDDMLLLTVTPAGEGYAATFDLALDLS